MNRPQLEVYEVQSADPREVTKTLDALLPGVVVNADGRARRIHILATPEEHRQIRAIINQLDGAASGQGVAVINLHRSDPLAVAGTLRSLFGTESDAPTIEADVAGRRLMIRGSAEQLAQIKSLLSQLGEDGTRQAAAEAQLARRARPTRRARKALTTRTTPTARTTRTVRTVRPALASCRAQAEARARSGPQRCPPRAAPLGSPRPHRGGPRWRRPSSARATAPGSAQSGLR